MFNSTQLWKQIKGSTSIKDSYEQSYVDYMKVTMEETPGHTSVFKNFDYVSTFDTLVMDYDTGKNLVGYKRFVSFPYETIQFSIGDYLHFKAAGDDSSLDTWLIFALDKQLIYNVNGKIKRCNNALKWKDSYGNAFSYPCVIDDKLNNSDIDFARQINVPQGGIVVYAQNNADTASIFINQRFILGKNVYKVNAFMDFTNANFLTLIMLKDNESFDALDDFTLGIANNSKDSWTVTIDQGSAFTRPIGYTATLTATVKHNGVITTSEAVLWESMNNSLAYVSGSGALTLLNNGTATIRCKLANNSDIFDTLTITIAPSGTVVKTAIIAPNKTYLYQGQTQVFTVQKYVNNTLSPVTFAITSNSIPAINCNFLVLSGNSFSVENLKAYPDQDLVVTCISNDADLTTETITIKLKGWW